MYRYLVLSSTILTSIRLDGVEALEGEGQISAAGRTGVSRRKAGEREREREQKINLKSGPLPQHGGDEYQVNQGGQGPIHL